MKGNFKKVLALLLAFLLTGVPQTGAVLAAELVVTEIVADVPNGQVTVVQGKSINIMVELSISDSESLKGYTIDNPGKVTLNTLYSLVGATWTSSNPTGVDQYGNELKFYDGGKNSYYVNITVSIDRYVVPRQYTTNIRKTIVNPNGGILQDQYQDTMIVNVVPADTIPPVVNITSPISGAYYNANNLPKFEYTARDEQDGYGIVIQNWGFSTEEGEHTATVAANDKSYNNTTKSVTYTIDKTPPEVIISYPEEGGYYSDATRLQNNDYSIKDDNQEPSKTRINETGNANGEHIFTVTAYDKAGNFTTKSVKFTMDSISPIVSINNPANGTHHQSKNLPEEANYTVVDDNLEYVQVEGYSKDREGRNNITVLAKDLAGNITRETSSYIVDNNAPVISINPLTQKYYKSNELPNFDLIIHDDYDPNPVYNTPVLENTPGLHAYKINAADKAGNTSSREIEYYIDDEIPALTIISPLLDRVYDSNAPLSLEYETTDNSGINPTVTIIVDGQLTQDKLLPTTKGEHTVIVTSTDAAGNFTTREVTYTLDTTPPEILLSQNVSSSLWTKDDINIAATIMDTNSGVAITKWAKGNRDTSYFASNGLDFSDKVFVAPENGIYTVYAKDIMGNECVKTIMINNIDKIAPSIKGEKINNPNEKGWYNRDAVVRYTYSDELSGIDDNTTSKEDTITVEGENLSSSCMVYDRAGNSACDSISDINIDKTGPAIEFNGVQYTTDASINLGDVIIGSPAMKWKASDNLSGLATNETGTIEFDKINAHEVPITATDNAGNTTTITVSYRVVYNFSGVLQPVKADGNSVFKAGSTVPVKFRLTNINGNPVTSAVARIYYAKYSNNVLGNQFEPVSINDPTIGNIFRYDTIATQYIFNLSTKILTEGTYRLVITLDDGREYDVRIGLK